MIGFVLHRFVPISLTWGLKTGPKQRILDKNNGSKPGKTVPGFWRINMNICKMEKRTGYTRKENMPITATWLTGRLLILKI